MEHKRIFPKRWLRYSRGRVALGLPVAMISLMSLDYWIPVPELQFPYYSFGLGFKSPPYETQIYFIVINGENGKVLSPPEELRAFLFRHGRNWAPNVVSRIMFYVGAQDREKNAEFSFVRETIRNQLFKPLGLKEVDYSVLKSTVDTLAYFKEAPPAKPEAQKEIFRAKEQFQ